MHTNEETLQAIRLKALELLLKWEIIEKSAEPPIVVVFNPVTRVSVSSEMSIEDGRILSFIYKVTDQTSILRPKKATIVFYSDGDFHCEYSAFKSEEDILLSLTKTE